VISLTITIRRYIFYFSRFFKIGEKFCLGEFYVCSTISWLNSVCLFIGEDREVQEVNRATRGVVCSNHSTARLLLSRLLEGWEL